MTIQEALDLYPEMLDFRLGKPGPYPFTERAAAELRETHQATDLWYPDGAIEAMGVIHQDVVGTLAEAYWRLTRGDAG